VSGSGRYCEGSERKNERERDDIKDSQGLT